MVTQKTLHPSAGVDATIVEDEHQHRVGKDLMQLMEKGDKRFGIALGGAFPVKALGATMQGPEERRSLAFLGRRLLMRLAFRRPASLDIRGIGEMGFIFKEDL